MDKVIIDGVDVSECKYYDDGTCCDKDILTLSCDKADCIYKQLKRLQAEYDDLHLSYAGCKTANTGLQEVNQKLEQENNELCKRMAEVTYRVTGGRLSYPNYTLDAIEQAFYDQLEILSDKKSEEYKQALQEIRDIALIGEHCEGVGCDFMPKILTKINEVIGE